MANHVRQQIREYFGTNLNNLTTTGTRVHESRVYPLDTLPALVIYTKSETSEPLVMHTDRVMQRSDVQGAFSQRALLDTYTLDEVVDDQGTTKATAALNAEEARIMGEIQALNAKQGTLSADEEKQIKQSRRSIK